MEERKAIGLRIASMRGFRRLTQEELGGMTGVTKQTVSSWEHGHRMPDPNSLIALCKALGCTSDYLLGLVDDPRGHYGAHDA